MFRHLSSEYQTIGITIRNKILLHTSQEPLMLNEGKIASEYGLSRTPIRQILQSLAVVHMVETRAGKGTFAKPLEPGKLLRDMRTSTDLLWACGRCSTHDVPNEIVFQMMAISSTMEALTYKQASGQAIVDALTKLGDCLILLIEDPLLSATWTAVFYRMVRWRVCMFETEPEENWTAMTHLVNTVLQGAKSGEPGGVFNAFADLAESNLQKVALAKDQPERELVFKTVERTPKQAGYTPPESSDAMPAEVYARR